MVEIIRTEGLDETDEREIKRFTYSPCWWKYYAYVDLAAKHDNFDILYKVDNETSRIHYERENDFEYVYEMAYESFKYLYADFRGDPDSHALKASIREMNKLIEYVISKNDMKNLNYLVTKHPLAFRRHYSIEKAIMYENYEAYKLMEPLYTFGDWGRLIEESLTNKTPDIFKDLIQKHPIRKIYRALDRHGKREWQKYIPK